MINYNIYSVCFADGDWLYSIKYGDGKDSFVLKSNDMGLESITSSLQNVSSSLRDFLGLKGYEITIRSVRFSQEGITTKATINLKAFTVEKEERSLNIITEVKIPKNIDYDDYSFSICVVLKHVRELKAEFLKYLNGERLQLELNV